MAARCAYGTAAICTRGKTSNAVSVAPRTASSKNTGGRVFSNSSPTSMLNVPSVTTTSVSRPANTVVVLAST
jgi:hypothetical protein